MICRFRRHLMLVCMTREDSVANRALQVAGGCDRAVFLIKTNVTGADSSRGIIGTVIEHFVELKPTPIVRPVSGYQLSRMSEVLRAGDYQIEVAGFHIAEEDLRMKAIKFCLGNRGEPSSEVINVVLYEPQYLGNKVMLYTIFCRSAHAD